MPRIIKLPPHTKLGAEKLSPRSKNQSHNYRLYGKYEEIRKTPRFKQWHRNQFLRQGGTCYYCHEPLWLSRINVEHIKPRSKGGDNNWANMVLACAPCNKDKGSKLLSQAKRKELFIINRKKRGTYLKNREHYNRLYGEFTDQAIIEKIKNLR